MTRKRQIKKTNTGARPPKGKAASASAPIDGPTPEQAARVVYERGAVRDEAGRLLAMAYRREPLFETMAKKRTIAPDELEALRYFRGAFDRSERSATKSCLNVGVGGGMRGMPADLANATASMIDAKRRLRSCEAVLGANLATLRGVALDDRSISDLAIERFGARRQSWIIVDEPVMHNGRVVTIDGVPQTHTAHREKVVPRSGRHRAIVASEFQAGVKLLAAHLKRITNMGGAEEIWIEVEPDGRAELVRGICAPARRYRWWGSKDVVAEVMGRARSGMGPEGLFPSAAAARSVIERANEATGWRLQQLEPEELAA